MIRKIILYIKRVKLVWQGIKEERINRALGISDIQYPSDWQGLCHFMRMMFSVVRYPFRFFRSRLYDKK